VVSLLKMINNIEWNILLICHWNVIRMINSIVHNIDYNEVYKKLNIEYWTIFKINLK